MNAEILNVAEMYRADSLAMAGGIAGETLMEAAGWAVAREVCHRFRPCRVTVLCGPGNNGGDGFVIARLLSHQGFVVRLALLGDVANLKGDAALMAGRWPGPVEMLDPVCLEGAELVVDSLFGAGLARPLDGPAAETIAALRRLCLPVIAVDVPSGVDGDTGAVLGLAPQAVATVTFFRKKPGHLLYPGRALCGEVVVAGIGIPAEVLTEVEPAIVENDPTVWAARFPWPGAEGHKYQRGHVTILGGAVLTGAARLAARAARRAGAGLVTIAAADAALAIYRMADPGNMVLPEADLIEMLADPRRNAWIMGPGAGQGEGRRAQLKAVLEAGRKCVLDADSLTWFSGCKDSLRRLLSPSAVLTPHDGEFDRLFGDVAGSRLERARQAASCSGAVVVLKGADTVIAHPDGRAAINANAPPWLATAGSGDVLAGIIGGLLAAGSDGFDAACAGVWMHGAAATAFGPGLIAEDIAETLPLVLRNLYQQENAPKS
ncbi:NAD(P)H-hydrate dehydratase [Magnetospirillum sulfuroxidans]|uniref:Bifunctional NAD(P)H-hydrate repair enzyme n=1 Tax=Magnetospirillum sulfuroxidans TaxID=611300 RepID=A0ABS5I8N0_9PROT|nr:NAD(P)H-hydrate dehydratase [Magnetospirillum sulfuroxidans]MBR9970770.1 NAD(P)H-hydrate dehydratase [Magnetospirillum sulfuroxidans]